ncbi:phage tail protein [Mucilaginibacter sp. 21P]|uniref:phage tail protein n=1 Tax=Mucilaginibacter sp. 21P TaxID=2778902 RepID=UPI001C55F40C|nr:phage tail protein [Mucilaginibacter sp. 21P]QXV63647.1 phage tail protein [Mucilaginibacter sp. 21P]
MASGLIQKDEDKQNVLEDGVYAHQLPTAMASQPLTLKHGIISKDSALYHWLSNIIEGNRPIQVADLRLIVADNQGNDLIEWIIDGAYPISLSLNSGISDDHTALIEEVTMAYRSLVQTGCSA